MRPDIWQGAAGIYWQVKQIRETWGKPWLVRRSPSQGVRTESRPGAATGNSAARGDLSVTPLFIQFAHLKIKWVKKKKKILLCYLLLYYFVPKGQNAFDDSALYVPCVRRSRPSVSPWIHYIQFECQMRIERSSPVKFHHCQVPENPDCGFEILLRGGGEKREAEEGRREPETIPAPTSPTASRRAGSSASSRPSHPPRSANPEPKSAGRGEVRARAMALLPDSSRAAAAHHCLLHRRFRRRRRKKRSERRGTGPATGERRVGG